MEPTTPQQPPNPPSTIKDKLKAFGALIAANVKAILAKAGGTAVVVLTLGGILFVIAKYRDLLIDLIVGSAKREVDSAQKQDNVLKAKEDAAKTQSAQLEQQISDLDTGKTKVDDDWNKK